MMKNICLHLSAICTLLLFSCSGPKPKSVDKDTVAVADTGILADKNFAYHNLASTLPLWRQIKFDDGKMYADSNHKVVFKELSAKEKFILIAPFIMKETGVGHKDYVAKYMQAFFIAKQEKVGAYQPIILSIGGDDYSSLTVIILDKNNKPVDGYNLCGGVDGGPSYTGDSLMTYPINNYSNYAKNRITTYHVDISEYNDSLKKASIIDSTVFESVISNNGKIITKQTVNKTYRRPYKH